MASFIQYTSLLIIVGLLFCSYAGEAQSTHLSGTVNVSVEEGTIEADMLLSNLPATSDYSILLNTGMNIRHFRDSASTFFYGTRRYYDEEESVEGFQYYLPSNDNQSRYLPSALRIAYTGAFPVKADTANMSDGGDWKGNIALNGKTIRASEQTLWYPVLFDRSSHTQHTAVTYNLTINCADCEDIYVNGSPPQSASQATFKSDQPYAPLMFAGDFDTQQVGKSYFINTRLSTEELERINRHIEEIRNYYKSKLSEAYGAPITFIKTSPVAKKRDWGFVTYPTVVQINHTKGLNGVFDEDTEEVTPDYRQFLAHELGHYYFGTLMMPNAQMQWILLEGVTEYLSLQFVRDRMGEDLYSKSLKGYANSINNKDHYQPLSQIELGSQLDRNYRYSFAPLLFTALEREVGREAMWQWMQELLKTGNTKTDYAYFVQSLQQAGIDQETFETVEKSLLEDPDALAKVTGTTRSGE